jgi:PAS domain S-box-containing protein
VSTEDDRSVAPGPGLATKDELVAALQLLPDPVFILKAVRAPDGSVEELTYAFLNEAAARLHGRPIKAVLGHGHCELFPSVRESGIWDTYLVVIESGSPESLVVPWFEENGVQGSFRLIAARCGDGLLVSVTDVTEQRRAERELAETSRRYQLLAENASDFVVETTPDGVTTWVSSSVTGVLGWQPEDLVGRSGLDFAHPDDVAALQDPAARATAGLDGTGEIRLRCADGTYRWVSRKWSLINNASGTLVARVAGMRDVQAEVEARHALSKSEERYRLLAENATDVVTLTDRDRRVLWLSPSVTRTLGWTPEELVGTRLSDLVHPDDRESTASLRDALYAGQEVTPPENGLVMRIQSKSGAYRWVSPRATAVTNESGTFEGLVGGWQYVDDLVHAQQAIQAERAALRATVDSLLDPQVLYDAVRDDAGQVVDLEFVDANPAACAYFEMDQADLIGSRLLDLFPGHVEAGLFEKYRQVLETGEPLAMDDFDYVQELLETERRYDIRAARVGDGLSVVWRDVTDRHAAARRLAESEEHYRLVAENVSDVAMAFSSGRRFEWVSDSVAHLMGWQPSDLVGHLIDEFVHPDDLAQHGQVIADAATVSVMNVEFRFRRRDGTYRWVACRTRLRAGEDGTPIVVAGGLVDIQERKQAEAQELNRLAELERFQQLTVGRELKMIELKKEIEYLRKHGPAGGSDS